MIFNYLISAVVYLLFSCVIFAVALIVIYAHVLMHELFPLLHTHSPWSRSDDPGFARPDIGRFAGVHWGCTLRE